MATDPGVRTLADDLRARSDEALVMLLLHRPHLARPRPHDLEGLASRAQSQGTLGFAVDALDTAHLAALETVVADQPVTPDEVAERLGVDPDRLAPILDALWQRALLWHTDAGLCAPRALRDLLPGPATPPPPAADLGVHLPDDLAATLAAAPSAAAAVLHRLAAAGGRGVVAEGSGAAADAVTWLVDHGLATRDRDAVRLPRQVVDHVAPRSDRLTPPAVAGPTVDQAAADRASGAAASETLGLVEELLARWSAEPPRVLRAGGLAVRDLTLAARALDVTEPHAALLVEIAAAADLLGDDRQLEPRWAPTVSYDAWLGLSPGESWSRLADAWLRLDRAPRRVGRSREGTINALGSLVQSFTAAAVRRSVLQALAQAPQVAGTEASVVDLIQWRVPRRVPTDLVDDVDATLREAEWLGVTGQGALATAGRALTDEGPGVAAEALAEHLPAPVDHLLLQADLTLTVPGRMGGPLATFVRLVSDVESRGGASVHRISERSLRRAYDAGWDCESLLEALREASVTPVPQPLDYLVRDLAARHGQVRVSSAQSVVRCADSATLDQMLATRSFSSLQLRRVSDTVLTSSAPAGTVLELLRDKGFAPVAESSTGVVAVSAPPAHRAPARLARNAAYGRRFNEDDAYAVVAALRAARPEDDEEGSTSAPRTDPAAMMTLLREAVADRRAVWVGLTTQQGRTVRRLRFHPTRIEGGRVTGSADGSSMTLVVHRITGVERAD